MTVPPFSPTPNNLLIGAGELYLDRIVNNAKTGLWHVGNADQISIATEDQVLDKYSSMRAARPLYARRLQRRTVTLKAVLDEHGKENMAAFLMGQLATSTQTGGAIVGEVLFANVPAATLGAALGGKSFRVAKFGAISAVTVKVGAASIVLNTDYTLDLDRGVITILSASTVVTNGTDDLAVDYTATAITTLNHIQGGYSSLIEVSGLFYPDPTTGPKMLVEFWRGSISPDGEMNLVSEEWSAMTLNIALQDDSTGVYGGSANYPLYRVTYLP